MRLPFGSEGLVIRNIDEELFFTSKRQVKIHIRLNLRFLNSLMVLTFIFSTNTIKDTVIANELIN